MQPSDRVLGFIKEKVFINMADFKFWIKHNEKTVHWKKFLVSCNDKINFQALFQAEHQF